MGPDLSYAPPRCPTPRACCSLATAPFPLSPLPLSPVHIEFPLPGESLLTFQDPEKVLSLPGQLPKPP